MCPSCAALWRRRIKCERAGVSGARRPAIHRLNPQLRLRRRTATLVRLRQQAHAREYEFAGVGRPYGVRERELIEVMIRDCLILRGEEHVEFARLTALQI